ncbi:MAG: M20/M25/M40 family metallo-hydrolase [Deltaproteobacteria bacterium]
MIQKERMTEHAMDLIRIDSLSRREREVALRLKRDMEAVGGECIFDGAGDKVGGNVGNLIVRIEGNARGAPPFFLSSHMDTVAPGEGIKPRIDGGVIRSDGATILGSDDKSGLAVIVEVIRTLKERGLPHGDIELAFTICEEVGLLGARHIDSSKFRSKQGVVLDSASPFHLVTKCPSADRLEFTVHGLEAHAGVCPERGVSAIKIASEAIAAMRLGRIDFETTANVGVIRGGIATNIVPKFVEIIAEARSHNEEKLRAQTLQMSRCLHEAASRYENARIEERVDRTYWKMDVSLESSISKLVSRASSDLGYQMTPSASGGGCDANYFNRQGIECVNLGTGMKEIHTVNEYLVLSEFYAAAEIILEAITRNAADG